MSEAVTTEPILPSIVSAWWSTFDGTHATGLDADGVTHQLLLGDPRLVGIEVAPYVAPPRRVKSVPTLAWRRAMRQTPSPSGTGTALAFVEAAAQSNAELNETLRYMQRAERADMIAMGIVMGLDIAQVDSILTLAAMIADPSDVVTEIVPTA